jgi:peptide deformylase
MRNLRFYGDPVLRRKARPVEAFDAGLRELADDLIRVMRGTKGVGMAANQLGDLRRVFAIDPSAGDREEDAFAIVNPVITQRSGAWTDEEGCLSFPGLRVEIRRAMDVRVEGADLAGNPVAREFSGLLARAVQHELDHLDGVLFVDRLPLLQRIRMWFRLRKLKSTYRKLAAPGTPVETPST